MGALASSMPPESQIAPGVPTTSELIRSFFNLPDHVLIAYTESSSANSRIWPDFPLSFECTRWMVP